MSLRVVPLGGLGEIGMNCMVLEADDGIVVIDCGLMFTDLANFGVEFVIPDFTYLVERKDKIKAILLTHGHEDHVGALPFLVKAGVRAPIYASPFTRMLIEKRLEEYGLMERAEITTIRHGSVVHAGPFKAEFVTVNHSIVDAMALIIDTPVGRVVHTGDFRIDPTPYLGTMMDLERFRRAGDEGVQLLLSDSTNVERTCHSLSESVITQAFELLFARAQGMIVVSMFASNVARMAQVLDTARKTGRKVALAGRTMIQNAGFGEDLGFLKNCDDLLIDIEDIDRYPRNKILVLSTGSQGEYRSALVRMAHGEHGQVQLQEGDLVLMSSKFIPGNEKAIGRMINSLFKQGAEVLYEAVHDIHASGHATKPELKQMLELTRPKFFAPVHGEYRHLVHHARLARETGMTEDRVRVTVNGDVLALSKDKFSLLEHIEESRVLVEGRDGNDVTSLVLKERRQMGEKGVVFVMMVRNAESRRIVSGPEVLSKGLAGEDAEAWLIEEATRVAQKIVDRYDKDIGHGRAPLDLQETVRVELRRFFNNNIGKKPVVMPVIIDL